MKKINVKILIIVLCAILSIFCINHVVSVKADSGWDTEYSSSSRDSGSDYSSGRDYSSDRDYGDGSSGGGSSSGGCTTEQCKRNRFIISLVGIISFSAIFNKSMSETGSPKDFASFMQIYSF